MPPEFPDFRPLLQRAGLILLGWSRWDSAPLDFERPGQPLKVSEGMGPWYEVNWITSAPGRKHRRYAADCYITEEKIPGVKPVSSAGPYFFQGICGKPCDFKYVKDREVADYVFACAPWDINRRTIPGFITELKAAGVNVDWEGGGPYPEACLG
jgi:hypothetical protein